MSYYAEFYLYIHQPTVLASGTITSITETSYPYRTVVLNVTSGDLTDAKGSNTISFGTDGAKGRTYISGYDYGATTVVIGASSRGNLEGEVDIQAGDTFEVWSDHRVWSKFQRFDFENNAVFKDYNTAATVNQVNYRRPIPNGGLGEKTVALLSAGSASVTLDQSSAVSVDSSLGAFSYAHSSLNGTVINGTTATPTVDYVATGLDYVTRTVSVSSPVALSGGSQVPVLIDDLDNLISKRVILEETELSFTTTGAVLTTTVYEDINSYPRGTLGIFWVLEWIDGVQQDPRTLFIGWEAEVSNALAADEFGAIGSSELRFVDARGKLEQVGALAQVLEPAATAATWLEFPASKLTIDVFMDYTLREHSTVGEVCDLHPSGTSYILPAGLQVAEGNFAEQADYISQAIGYRTVCDVNQLRMVKDVNREWYASHSGVTDLALSEDSDFSELSFLERKFPQIGWIRGNAILAGQGAANAFFVVSPGKQPGQGAGRDVRQQQLVASLLELQQRTGMDYQRANLEIPEIALTLTNPEDPGVRPSSQNWCSLTTTSLNQLPRGKTYSTERLVPVELTLSFEVDSTSGIPSAQWSMTGEPEITLAYAAEEEEDLDEEGKYGDSVNDQAQFDTLPGLPIPIITEDIPNGYYWPHSTQKRLGLVDDNGFKYVSTNINAVFPTWTSASLGLSGTVLHAKAIPSTAYIQDGATDVDVIAVTTTTIYKIENFFSSSPTVTAMHSIVGTPQNVEIDISLADFDTIVVMMMNHTKQWVAISTDGGSTFSETTIISGSIYTGSFARAHGLALSPFDANTAYFYEATGVRTFRLSKTTNLFSSFAATVPAFSSARAFGGLYASLQTSGVLYGGVHDFISAPTFYKFADGGVVTDLTPVATGNLGPLGDSPGIPEVGALSPLNDNYFVGGFYSNPLSSLYHVISSADGMVTKNFITSDSPTDFGGSQPRFIACGDKVGAFIMSTGSTYYLFTDNGNKVREITGDFSAAILEISGFVG